MHFFLFASNATTSLISRLIEIDIDVKTSATTLYLYLFASFFLSYLCTWYDVTMHHSFSFLCKDSHMDSIHLNTTYCNCKEKTTKMRFFFFIGIENALADDTYFSFWWLRFHLSLGFTVNYFSIILSFETDGYSYKWAEFWRVTVRQKRRRRREKRWPKGVSCCLYIYIYRNRLGHTYKSSIIRTSTNEE